MSAKNVGITHNVNNVEFAVEQLLTWPDQHRPKWQAAAKTCLAALEGKKTPDDARKAFEAAAIEAGMLRQFRG